MNRCGQFAADVPSAAQAPSMTGQDIVLIEIANLAVSTRYFLSRSILTARMVALSAL